MVKPFQQTPPLSKSPSCRAATERIITFPPKHRNYFILFLLSIFQSLSGNLERGGGGEDTVRFESDRLDKKTETDFESIESRLQLSLFLHPHSKTLPLNCLGGRIFREHDLLVEKKKKIFREVNHSIPPRKTYKVCTKQPVKRLVARVRISLGFDYGRSRTIASERDNACRASRQRHRTAKEVLRYRNCRRQVHGSRVVAGYRNPRVFSRCRLRRVQRRSNPTKEFARSQR